ncbi:MAG: response regulator, partial [Draconibacterium sp.]|nr:response regulator [Draconibacterium sp.]
GKGSEFWFNLKFEYKNEQNKETGTGDADIPKELKILYAEDNLVNQKVTEHLLQKIGVKCDIAGDGMKAFEMFKLNCYDIILMDMQMPVLDGTESTVKIREYEQSAGITKPVYIIAVTANAFLDDKQKCFGAGMNNFISKPFNIADLKKIIKTALSE